MYNFNDNYQQALGFLVSQTTYIEPQVYRVRYPELNYAEFIPVDSSGSEWAKSITFFSVDQLGRADWITGQSRDIPIADITRAKHESAIEMAGIGYNYNLEELGVAMLIPGTNLTTERAAAARRASEQMIHDVAMYGDTRKNWKGLTNLTLPAITVASHTWLYDLTNTPGTPDVTSVLEDVNGAITNIWQSTLTVEMANTILLPIAASTLLSITQLPHTDTNLLDWLKRNNQYTQETGMPLTIRSVRGLDTAGSSGNARMIVYRKDPEAIKLHIPMPHRFFPVWQTGPFMFDVPGAFRMGGLELRLPSTMRYVDGI
jgi:hypothetical protein